MILTSPYNGVIIVFNEGGEYVSPKGSINTERVNVFFSPEAVKKLKELADEKGTTLSGIIRMITLEYLAKK